MCELAGLMGLEGVQKEIEKTEDLEMRARRSTTNFAKKAKKIPFQEVDNMVRSWSEKGITGWCKMNKVYEETTESEIQEIRMWETPDDGESFRLNGKYV